MANARKVCFKIRAKHAFLVHRVHLAAPICLFWVISLPQHIRGTLHASSDPELQAQAFFSASSKPQVSQKNRSPSFMSQQFAMESLLWFLFCFGVIDSYPLSLFLVRLFSQFLQIPSIRTSTLSIRPGYVFHKGSVSTIRLSGLKQSICPHFLQ